MPFGNENWNPTEAVIRKRWGLGTMVPEQDWREVPGMVDRDHLIAYQRNFRGPGDWRYEGLVPPPSQNPFRGMIREINNRMLGELLGKAQNKRKDKDREITRELEMREFMKVINILSPESIQTIE